MKVRKFKLEQIKVKSFVTKLDGKKSNTINGGFESLADTCYCDGDGDGPATTTTIDTGGATCIVNGETLEFPCIAN